MILGIDEVGRGPWAGPLVMGAVILGDAAIEGLTDSKKLTKRRREALDLQIRAQVSAFGLGWVSAEELDAVGMSQALVLACQRAVEAVDTLGVAYDQIVIDGTINFLKDTAKGPYVTTLKRADLLIQAVSAASIIAKVARDAYMTEQAALYLQYGFERHVGYGTAAHIAAIEKYGVTPLHRLSFAPLQKYAPRPTVVAGGAPKHRSSPLPSSPISQKSARRSLDAGPASKSAPSFEKSEILSKAGAAPLAVTRLVPGPTTRQIGDASESAAAVELERRGHRIVERNWKTKLCEIDIISTKRGVLYFIEVKHRKSDREGDGLAAITPRKLKQMKFAAEMYAHSIVADTSDMRLIAVATTGDPPHVTDFVLLD